jgi:hypothetical protein
VAHAYNPNYSGDRDHEDRHSKPARANRLRDPKKTHHKNKAGGVAQSVGPEFKPQHHKKRKKNSEGQDVWLKWYLASSRSCSCYLAIL